MKKLFIIVIGVLLMSTIFSQDLTIRTLLDTNGILFDSKGLAFPGKTRESLYVSVLDWAVGSSHNIKSTVPPPVKDRLVKIESIIPGTTKGQLYTSSYLSFITRVDVKDGYLLFKVSHIKLCGISHSPYGSSPYRTPFERSVLRPNATVKAARRPKRIRAKVEEALSNYLSSLVAHINNDGKDG